MKLKEKLDRERWGADREMTDKIVICELCREAIKSNEGCVKEDDGYYHLHCTVELADGDMINKEYLE